MPSTASSSPRQSRAHKDVAKKWKCPYCDKSFRKSRVLKKHVTLHTHKRRHPCDLCEKSFGQKYHLDRHRLLHTGERPYQCAECSKPFTTKYNLDAHFSRAHLSEKPHQCQMCHRRFAVKSDLAMHLKRLTPCVLPREVPLSSTSMPECAASAAQQDIYW
ncbi:gastrula zinc finger protein XlCGF49.1-like [Frankliniella occidentalis]|uniref:Gastrula zinc finger protein XlCGF49.1-like n=1 Tax=Frankliniella occidentalis TaxID=133901 RepID=A0A9C6XV58_FRAOC|nr:gastrula zinc finger protein XlCGF49.1-like [Frankliniella occidentalis]